MLAKKDADIKDAQVLVQKLRNEVQPLAREAETIHSRDIPQVEKQKENLQKELQTWSEKMDEAAEELTLAKMEEEKVTKLLQDSEPILILHRDVSSSQQKVATEEGQLKKLSINSTKPFEQLKTERDRAKQQEEDLTKELDTLRNEYHTKQEERNEANKKLSQLKDELSKLRVEAEQIKRYQDQCDKLVEQIQEIQKEMQDEQSKEPTLKEELTALESNLEKMKKEHAQAENTLQQSIDLYRLDLQVIQPLHQQVKQYMNGTAEDDLQNTTRTVDKLKARKQAVALNLKDTEAKYAETSKQIEDQALIKKELEDNREYRKHKANTEKYQKDLANWNQKYKDLTGSEKINEKDLEEKKNRKNKLLNEKHEMLGRVKASQTSIANMQKELKDPALKDVEQAYRANLIKQVTTETANADLDKYAKALDKYVIWTQVFNFLEH